MAWHIPNLPYDPVLMHKMMILLEIVALFVMIILLSVCIYELMKKEKSKDENV